MKIKIAMAILGIVGILMCGSSVAYWLVTMGELRHIFTAITICFFCACGISVCCFYIMNIWEKWKNSPTIKDSIYDR